MVQTLRKSAHSPPGSQTPWQRGPRSCIKKPRSVQRHPRHTVVLWSPWLHCAQRCPQSSLSSYFLLTSQLWSACHPAEPTAWPFSTKQQNTDRWQGWKTRRPPSLSLLAEIIHDNGIETDGGLVTTSKSQHLLSHGLRDQAWHGHTHR